MFKFGKTSLRRMEEVYRDLTETAHEALALADNDMTIPWMGGLRTATEQRSIFNEGNSRADGFDKKSYHQSGAALDIIPYIDGAGDYKAEKELVHFAGMMLTVFNYRKAIGEIPRNRYLHWGGFWGAKDLNGDGILSEIDDKTGWDKAHWEIRRFPQKRVLTINI